MLLFFLSLFCLSLCLSLCLSFSLSPSFSVSLTLSRSPFGEPFRRSKAALSAQHLLSQMIAAARMTNTHTHGCVHARVNTSIIDSMLYGATSTEDALYAACSVLTLRSLNVYCKFGRQKKIFYAFLIGFSIIN